MTATKITAEDKVRKAYAQAAEGEAGKFVKLISLRYALCAKGLDFTAQDEVLTEMFKRQELNLVPQSNQQALTRDQRATALSVGGEDKHLVSIIATAG
jgi:hypothetical protein